MQGLAACLERAEGPRPTAKPRNAPRRALCTKGSQSEAALKGFYLSEDNVLSLAFSRFFLQVGEEVAGLTTVTVRVGDGTGRGGALPFEI